MNNLPRKESQNFINSNLKKAGIEMRIKQNSVHVCSNTTPSFL